MRTFFWIALHCSPEGREMGHVPFYEYHVHDDLMIHIYAEHK